jgi:hypothetical protein
MTEVTRAGIQALPPRARLLHVGLVKTGTTALQSTASRRRRLLLRHGVRYPGNRYNHRQAAFAVRDRVATPARGAPDEWDRLLAEVEADASRRILISNEFIADWDVSIARRFAEDLGPRTHVVFTLRSFAALLPSAWQQHVKAGYRADFEQFLSDVLADRPDPAQLPPNFERHDQGEAVTRWADVVGPENVTVVVVDKAQPARIPAAFEQLLSLPPGLLADPAQRGDALNRSLAVHEAALLLAVNQRLEPYRVAEEDLVRVLRRGATTRILQECPAPGPQDQLRLPPWAAEAAAVRGQAYATAIREARVRVIGDLDDLGRAPTATPGSWTMPASVPIDVAAEALLGALSGGLRRGSNFGLPGRARPRSWARVTAKLVSRMRRFPAAVRRQLSATP